MRPIVVREKGFAMILHPHVGENSQEKIAQHNLSVGYDIAFTVLYREDFLFKRDKGEGKVLRMDRSEIEISTSFPLKVNQVLYWGDSHIMDNVHLAIVKRSQKAGDTYRVGLSRLS